jgi:type I restriction enzyme S subunit
MSKDKLIPKLRFPEFNNEEQWDSTQLDDLCELITKGTTPTTLGFSYTESGVNFIKIESILEGNINLEKAAFISIECNEALKRSQLKEDDILFSIAGALGVVTTVTEEILPANTNQALSIVRLKNKRQKDYVKAFLKSNLITAEVQKIKAGAAQPNISLNQVANFKILIPKNTKEQQKIATCLSSLDEVIAAHSQKLDLLKDHKKGLMQNLFPQEGEKIPKYRFKEFEKDGDWEEKRLGDLIELKGRIGYRGYTLEDIVGKGEGAISMSPSNINEFGTLGFTKSTYITWAKYEESPEIMLENGFTVLVKTGSTYGKVAFIKNLTEKTTINPQLVVLKPKKVNNYFLYLLVANESIQRQINATVVGGAIPTLSQESISNFEILVPKIKEQEKIAECLSTLNDLIISQTERIEQLKLHKKGLMQGLFPKLQD